MKTRYHSVKFILFAFIIGTMTHQIVFSEELQIPPKNVFTVGNIQPAESEGDELSIDYYINPEDLAEYLENKPVSPDCAFGDISINPFKERIPDDYIFVFKKDDWSNTYDDGLITFDRKDLPNKTIFTNTPFAKTPFNTIGGGFGLFGDETYHICLGSEFIDWDDFDLTAEKIKEKLVLERNDKSLLTPGNIIIEADSNPVRVYWSPQSDDEVVTLILRTNDVEDSVQIFDAKISEGEFKDTSLSVLCDLTPYNTFETTYYLASAIPEDGEYKLNEDNWKRSAWAQYTSLIDCNNFDDPSDPAPNPDPDPSIQPDPESIDRCPKDGRDGVYFSRTDNGSYYCEYSIKNISSFASTPLKDNGVETITVIGDWKIDVFEDIDFQGRHATYHKSIENLDLTSLGGQISSAKVESTEQTCPTDNRDGAYMFSNRNHDGRCTYLSLGEIPDLGEVEVGDNDLSSIWIKGPVECKAYEDKNFGGRYDVLGSDDPDLDIRSLGGQFSSIRCYEVTIIPTNTPTPTPTLAPTSIQLLNPSSCFESGNLNGWTQIGGNIQLGTDNAFSGNYHVRRTTAEEAHLTRDFDISQYSLSIDQGLGSAFFSGQIDVGKSEKYRYFIQFLDANGAVISSTDAGWKYHAGGYREVSGVVNTIPQGARTIRMQVGMRRDSGSNTDVDVDHLGLTVQFGAPVFPTATAIPTSTPSPTLAYTPTPIPTTPLVNQAYIVDDSITSGWGVWSWGTIATFIDIPYAYSGTKSYEASINQGYAGVYLRYTGSEPYHTDQYGTVNFAVYSFSGGERLRFRALIPGTDNFAPAIKLDPLNPGWNHFSIDTAELGVDHIEGLFWQNDTSSPMPTILLDDVYLIENGSAQPTSSPTPTIVSIIPVVIFDDELGANWDDWSWGTVANFNESTFVFSGDQAISVTHNQGYAGFQLKYEGSTGFNVSDYDSLVFDIYSESGGEVIRVRALYPGTSNFAQSYKIGPLASGWQSVSIDLDQLGVDQIEGLLWQNDTGSAMPTFYLDNIELR